MVTTGTKRGQNGRGERKSAAGRATKSATPAEDRPGPRLKLKLPFGPKAAEEAHFTTPAPQAPLPQDEFVDKEEELPVAEPTTTTTRRGRQVRRPHNADVIYGSELDRLVEQRSSQKIDDGNDYQRGMPSSPPYQSAASSVQILHLQPKRKPGRQPKNNLFQPSLEKVDEETNVSSSDTIAPHPPQPLHHSGVFLADLNPDVYQIMNALRSTSKIHLDLPALSNAARPGAEQPYTAKFLTHLYLLCYDSQLWNLCDLIADTWIRAFHQLRKQGERDERYQLWRPNTALWRRNTALERKKVDLEKHARNLKKVGVKPPPGVGFDLNPPDYELSVLDPALTDDVTDFNAMLLNELYQHTEKKCGARLLWADAMALGGDKMEKVLDGSTKRGSEWHADLLFNVMQTSLRMVRRKLTLKIEESTEGSWCRRYHEHEKHGLPCYRELAWRMAGEDESSDEDEVVNSRGVGAAEVRRGEKRSHGDLDGGRMSGAKRARVEFEVIDFDAEGDSEGG